MSSGVVRELYASDAEETPRPAQPRVTEWVLRVPLMAKLLGANLFIDVLVVLEPIVFPGGYALTHPVTVLILSSILSSTLVWLALRPIAQLEAAAAQVSSGDFNARVPQSVLADHSLARLAAMMNRLLSRVQADRARIEYLAGRSVRARDIEREGIARVLRDSLAQNVAGISLQIAAMKRSQLDRDALLHLDAMRATAADLNDEIRTMAESLHPGTMTEFGLGNALRAMGRVVGQRAGVFVRVDTDRFYGALSAQASGALYRVADEALRNVVQHSRARHTSLTLSSDANGVALEIVDDGIGLDVARADPLQSGLGLFSARTVLALAGGELHLTSTIGHGVRVIARIPAKALTRGAWQATS